jgi:alkyl sulfatase BDS1-like metallo-beta-lactamase superfamily hydrolase
MTTGLPPEQHAPKAATQATKAHQAEVKASLPFGDERSFDNAKRGFIATLEPLTIKRPNGQAVYDLTQTEFLQNPAPDTANPSLWRQAQLNAGHHGLYEVVDGIYQIRSFDLANMTVIRGTTGWIVIDPLTCAETSAAALALVNEHLGERKVCGVIITHSHVDHFGGVLGVVTPEQVLSGEVPLIAPKDFVHESLSENVLAGNAMGRRATYMYGNLLKPSATGFVSCGLGAMLALGSTGFLPPNDSICDTGETRCVDGIDIEFQMTMGTEAPAEMVFFFPQFNALCMSEITSHHLHNVYTPRGAQVRDAMAWSDQIQESMDLFGERLEVQFASHHWPTWGQQPALDYLAKQRDLYRYIHDQTLRLANHGLVAEEIAERIKLPASLDQEFSNRDYYGTVHHNARAVYVKYLGFFNGNPSSLHPLPPIEAGGRYLAFMGGAEAVVKKAQTSFDDGDYRWVAEVLNHVMMAEPASSAAYQAATALLADSLEQMGYQAESGPWRNFYLCGALELRHGVPNGSNYQPSPGVAQGMPLPSLFQTLGMRLNGPKAELVTMALNIELVDLPQRYLLTIENAVLHGYQDRSATDADATLKITSSDFKLLMLGLADQQELIAAGNVELTDPDQRLAQLLTLFDVFPRRFPIMTPRDASIR